MTRSTYNLSLRDRNLIRLERHERIENFHAQRMAETGDVELFDMDANLDDAMFPYPFGKTGVRKIDSLNITDKGRTRLSELYKTNQANYTAYQQSCRISEDPYDNEQVLYTPQGVIYHVNSGNRDHLMAFNKKVEEDNYGKIEMRSVDPDTDEPLLTDEQMEAFDLDNDNEGPLPALLSKS